MSDASERFARFVRPRLVAKLRAIGLDVEYHRARGDSLFYRDLQGSEVEVLDFLGGFGAGLLGHNHPEIVACLRDLLDEERPFHAQASVRRPAGELAERLSGRIGAVTGKRYIATFGNTGAEAVEAALKHAELERVRQWDRIAAGLQLATHEVRSRLARGTAHLSGCERLEPLLCTAERSITRARGEEPIYLALEGAFHGKTTGALRLTFNPEFRLPWSGVGPSVVFLPPGDEAALARTLAELRTAYLELELNADGGVSLARRMRSRIAACFVEPIQGEGGVREIELGYLRALRAAASAEGFPLVLDEIQTGMGRTGTFLASEPAAVAGDYYLLSKSLGGGLAKISALLVDADRYLPEFGYLHTSTFADDDLACTVALKVLDLLERDGGALLEQCRQEGAYLKERLRELHRRYPNQVREVRGRGLMVGVELAPQEDSDSPLIRLLSRQRLLAFFVSGHLLHEASVRVAPTLSAHGTIRLQPSAYVSREALDRLCAALEGALLAIRDGDAFALSRFLVGRSGERRPAIRPPGKVMLQPRARVNGARVGFLAHFLTPGDLREWESGLAPFTPDDCAVFLDRTRDVLSPFLLGRTSIESMTGACAQVSVIAVPFTSEQVMRSLREGDGAWPRRLVEEGVELARELGCAVVGLGGYTSIATDNCRSLAASDLALTSGNSLTAAAALAGLFEAADTLGLGRRILGVVGALGNIGRVLAELAADEVDEIVLLGRSGSESRLRAVAPAGARIASDLGALRACNLIVAASNSPRPIILPEHLGNGPVVVSDVALPADVDDRVATSRPDVLVLKGGQVRAPMGQCFDVPGLHLDHGEMYGCLAEAVLLGLAEVREHFSYGSLDPARVRQVRTLAATHGFELVARPARPRPPSMRIPA